MKLTFKIKAKRLNWIHSPKKKKKKRLNWIITYKNKMACHEAVLLVWDLVASLLTPICYSNIYLNPIYP